MNAEGSSMPRLCVFAGSSSGANPAYLDAARRLGAACLSHQWEIVYGGGGSGMMGALADAMLEGGGRVEGVIPGYMVEREWGHLGVSDLHVVETMHQRKQRMHDRCDAFLALPGGIGTFDELCEALAWQKLEIHKKPVGVLNTLGFFDPFLECLRRAVREGFYAQSDLDRLHVFAQPEEVLPAF